MWPWSRSSKPEQESKADNSVPPSERRAGGERVETAVLCCDLGAVVEVSRGGMSIRAERLNGMQLGETVAFELSAPADSMHVRARVVALELLPGRRYRVGLEFVEMSDVDRAAVENLARHGRRRSKSVFADPAARDRLVRALSMPDYYAVLGLRTNASDEEVREAYRELARKYHPDICRQEGAHARFCRINEANATLGDQAKRRAYDELYALRKAA